MFNLGGVMIIEDRFERKGEFTMPFLDILSEINTYQHFGNTQEISTVESPH